MLIYLRNKIENLIHEARNIRNLERKCKSAAVRTRIFAREVNVKKDTARLEACGYSEDQINKILRKATAARNKLAATEYQETIDDQMSKFFGLQNHRRTVVRREARATYLTIGFLKGLPYSKLEEFSFTPPDWNRIETLATTYGTDTPQNLKQRFAAWKDAAHEGIECKAQDYAYHAQKWLNAYPGTIKQYTLWSNRWRDDHEAKRAAHIEKLKAATKARGPYVREK